MLRSISLRARLPRGFIRGVAIFVVLPVLALFTESPAQNAGSGSVSRPAAEKPQTKPDESAAAARSLVDLNNALEGLAAKVAPAVVQILVTGYGPIHEENRAQTALIARPHAVGTGAIVYPIAYIMTISPLSTP